MRKRVMCVSLCWLVVAAVAIPAAASDWARWRRNLVAEGLAEIPQWGFSASPVVDGSLRVLNAGTSGIALDKGSGKVVWKSAPEAGGLSTPVFFDHGGRRLAAIVGEETPYAVDVTSGELACVDVSS